MKNKKIIIVFLLSLILFTNKVKADGVTYNGSATDPGYSTQAGDCKLNWCPIGNRGVKNIKLTIYYINNGSFEKQGTSIIWTSSKDIADRYDGTELVPDNIFDGNTSYTKINENIQKYFDVYKKQYKHEPTEKMKKFFKERIGEGYSFPEDSEYADYTGTKPATKGYRIIIEPVLQMRTSNNSSGYKAGLYTAKEIAKHIHEEGGFNCVLAAVNSNGSLSCGFPFAGDLNGGTGIAAYFYTDFKDVGISAESKSTCTTTTAYKGQYELAPKVKVASDGCGYNIIDITGVIDDPKCYEVSYEGSLKCAKSNEVNKGNFKEVYKEKSCTIEESKTEKDTEYGKLVGEGISSNCKMYCIESAVASFPGSIDGAHSLEAIPTHGTYFAWPVTLGNQGMRMFMKTKYTCTLVQEEGKTCTDEDIKKLKESAKGEIKKGNYYAELQAGNDKEINTSLTTYYDPNNKDVKITNSEIKFSEDKKGKMVSNKITLEQTIYFKIPENKNRLYNRESHTVFDGTITSDPFIDNRGEGVISLKNDLKENETEKTYNLILKNIRLGTSNQFGPLIGTYTCNYSVKIDPCKCPAGTLNEGDPLYEEMTEGKTCAELIETSCNVCKCPPNSYYEDKVLLLGEEATTKACEAKQNEVCYPNYCEYRDGRIDITECMNTQMSNGLTKEQAYTYCDEKLCPSCTDKYGIEHDFITNGCLEQGNSKAICEELYCPNDDGDTLCPPGKPCYCTTNCKWTEVLRTQTALAYQKDCDNKKEGQKDCGYVKLVCPGGEEKMLNAPNCIQKVLSKKLKGNTITEALNKKMITTEHIKNAFAACESEVCNSTNKKIIYRQIDLNDPFPGKEWKGTDKKVNASNNNQSKKNRMPGENWNSQTTIEAKILNARGAKGYELYNKDPLYIIKLTPETIKKIREYNNDNKYDDFNLQCTTVNKNAACISNFLHKSGTIKNLNPSDFVLSSYGDKKSINSCYNMSFSEASFKACYEKNN